jgi:hypothetical protein
MTLTTPAPPAHDAGWSARRWAVAGGVAALAGGALVTWWNPSDDGIVLCPFHAATGLDCPACGSLRAVAALGRGNLANAADHNVLLLVLPLLVAVGFVARRQGVSIRILAFAGAAIVLAFWVVRNLPGVPFLGSGIG